MPALGEIDQQRGEFWVENPFDITSEGENLSAFERNCVYLGLDGESFVDVSFASGVDLDSDSRSVICADFNNDGAKDILVASVGGGPLRLFINTIAGLGHRVKFNLVGTTSNRAAIGTRLVLRCGQQTIVRDNFPANGFMGQHPVEMLVGVGDAEQIDSLEVRWPDGKRQVYESMPADSLISLVEGEPTASVTTLGIEAR